MIAGKILLGDATKIETSGNFTVRTLVHSEKIIVNEIVIARGKYFEPGASQNIFVLPLWGAVMLSNGELLSAGQSMITGKNSALQLKNPLDAPVGLIVIGTNPEIISVADTSSYQLKIAKVPGRKEAFTNTKDAVFLYVIHGVFECCGRLLHEDDGLLLTEAGAADAEALSASAMIFLLESPLLL